jgi:hypothetical protein
MTGRRFSGPLVPKTTSTRQFNRRNKSASKVKFTKTPAYNNKKKSYPTAKSNFNAIAKLKRQIYGPLQYQRSLSAPLQVSATKPLLFQLNNPTYGPIGPQIMRPSDSDRGVIRANQFNLSTGNIFRSEDDDNKLNGPKMYMRYVDLQFKFEGYLQDCHITIDIIRQKKAISQGWWNSHNDKPQFMPHLAPALMNLAGFSANSIDKKLFQVLYSKKLYINSKGSKNVADALATTTGDEVIPNTTDGTTRHVKYAHLRVSLNRVFKQLQSSVHEDTGEDKTDQNIHTQDGNLGLGNYAFNNIHPLSNVWCVISCDDTASMTDVFTGDECKVSMIRECCWRDPLD